MMNPTHVPCSHLSSKSPSFFSVLGILNSTVSPNGTSLLLLRRPFINWYDVLPFSRTLNLVIRCAACRTIHGTMGSSRWIFSPVFSSTADRSVLTSPLRSWMLLSTLALELLSPTRDCSRAVPWPDLALTTDLCTSVMLASWSALRMILSCVRPIVSMSSTIWSATHASPAPFVFTAYAHMLLHRVSFITSTVMLTLAVVLVWCSSSLVTTSSVR